MVLGTASHVGKSLVTAALGRIFANEGVRVAPFKAQNMSLNSASTWDGREIGRAQALQAEACRVVACAGMNPILIKPSSETGSQVIVLGKVWGQVTASDYHLRRVEDLFPIVIESYQELARDFDLMLLEGAGSPAEINLRAHDIVNMRMAHAANAACLLVGDIDRGGVFASLLGTIELLDAEDRARIRGFAINKFRGDLDLLRPGIDSMEQRLGIPCAGVIPVLPGVALDEEDSVALESRPTPARNWAAAEGKLRIAVVALPHIANFTDFDPLMNESSVALAFVDQPADVERAHVLILPGTKQTLDDLAWLRQRGLDHALKAFEGPLVGICGGFQMFGKSIDDPHGVESEGKPCSAPGLGLLAVRTTMLREKTVRPATGEHKGRAFRGYEIHMGETVCDGERDDGGRVWGTYLHGLFDDDDFRHSLLEDWRKGAGLPKAHDYRASYKERDGRIERWSAHVNSALNMSLIRSWVAICLLLAVGTSAAYSQEMVKQLAAVIEREYFDQAVAERVGAALREGSTAGKYADIQDSRTLAAKLTGDLYELTHDKHLAVAVITHDAPKAQASDESREARARRTNAGFQKVEILSGNVGYLNITGFDRPELTREAMAGAMRFLRNAEAVIVDLRANGGGSPDTVTLLASYFFDQPSLKLFDIVGRSPAVKTTYLTSATPPEDGDGKRPVFLLTSARTFSAGEGFAFLLQERHRAEVIGEITAGAANPGRPYAINDEFEVTVPNGRVLSAVSGNNWEGIGVVPDMKVTASRALEVAHARAVSRLLEAKKEK